MLQRPVLRRTILERASFQGAVLQESVASGTVRPTHSGGRFDPQHYTWIFSPVRSGQRRRCGQNVGLRSALRSAPESVSFSVL